MDTGLMNLGEEHFENFSAFQYYNPAEDGFLETRDILSECSNNEWESPRATEINGDFTLIPVTSSSFSEPPNSSEFFQKLIEWTSYLNVNNGDNSESLEPHANLPENFIGTDFELAKYLEDGQPSNGARKFKAPVKKIDKVAQKYIISDDEDGEKANDSANSITDEVDIETIYEPSNMPVLEANDVLGLLEQFEASEKPNMGTFSIERIPEQPVEIFEDEKEEIDVEECDNVDVKKIEVTPVTTAIPANSDLKSSCKKITKKADNKVTDKVKVETKSKQILESLPQELIARISESGKRKTITVIPPMPKTCGGKRRNASKNIDSASQIKSKVPKTSNTLNKSSSSARSCTELIQLDHDYCSRSPNFPARKILENNSKDIIKDSGIESGEDEERAIIRNQPTVKNADGKLMVSLLKVNTIRPCPATELANKKKRLNLEEYKKRRLIHSATTSQSNSPSSSTCSSPHPSFIEDDILKHVKYEEKLKKMKEELLNTPPKSAVVSTVTNKLRSTVNPLVSKVHPEIQVEPVVAAPKVELPPDMDRVILVSVATNTDITEDVKTMAELQEIEPLLQKASDKIKSSSLITSLIENIPKVKSLAENKNVDITQEVVREDKIIVYLPKNRKPVETRNAKVQTTIEMVKDEKNKELPARYRRRIRDRSGSECSSVRSCRSSSRSEKSGYTRGRTSRASRRSSTTRSKRSRSSSASSTSSSSSDSSFASSRSSSLSRSRSRSRSVSPKRLKYSKEYVREVEERRVIYVGQLAKATTHDDLRRRFLKFGRIKNIKINHRDDGDPYGFVTFANREDAYQAVEHGNDGNILPKYDLSFGGRRLFCQAAYADLDNVHDDVYGYGPSRIKSQQQESFDDLLREFQSLRNRRKP